MGTSFHCGPPSAGAPEGRSVVDIFRLPHSRSAPMVGGLIGEAARPQAVCGVSLGGELPRIYERNKLPLHSLPKRIIVVGRFTVRNDPACDRCDVHALRRARATACRQPARAASRPPPPLGGSKRLSMGDIFAASDLLAKSPTPTAASIAAPRAVVSRSTGRSMVSAASRACSLINRSLAAAPPSTRIL